MMMSWPLISIIPGTYLSHGYQSIKFCNSISSTLACRVQPPLRFPVIMVPNSAKHSCLTALVNIIKCPLSPPIEHCTMTTSLSHLIPSSSFYHGPWQFCHFCFLVWASLSSSFLRTLLLAFLYHLLRSLPRHKILCPGKVLLYWQTLPYPTYVLDPLIQHLRIYPTPVLLAHAGLCGWILQLLLGITLFLP